MPASQHCDFLSRYELILGEGAVIERLRRDSRFELDPHVVNSGFVYDAAGRAALAAIIGSYIAAARDHDLPLLLSTPTWRASRERIAAAGLAGRDVNLDNVQFLDELRGNAGEFARKIGVCGLLSCRGNAYAPAEALDAAAAREFHLWQVERLAATQVDFLLAATLPALSEATGLALALSGCGKPYVISFVIRRGGTLLDGTPLHQAISTIDDAVATPPYAYLVNCSHASIFRAGLANPVNSSELVRRRIIGLLANTAKLEPEELDDSSTLVEEDPQQFAVELAALRTEFGSRILGGCCGTDDRHIRALATCLRAFPR